MKEVNLAYLRGWRSCLRIVRQRPILTRRAMSRRPQFDTRHEDRLARGRMQAVRDVGNGANQAGVNTRCNSDRWRAGNASPR